MRSVRCSASFDQAQQLNQRFISLNRRKFKKSMDYSLPDEPDGVLFGLDFSHSWYF